MPDRTKSEELKALAGPLAEALDADILLCNAGMDRGLERLVVNLCRARKRRSQLILILVTSGGDADVAFRIARSLQCFYDRFTCIISGWCKSAGTLLTLGATEVAFGVHGELGPLDVQMAKKDELLDVESGLTVMTALTAIHEKTFLAFEHFFINTIMNGGGRLTVQTSSEIAVGLACGLFAPISKQIDPTHMGEALRSMSIATEYGQRLIDKSRNVKPNSLDKIISGYPSHGFVIDRIEAESIFERSRECSEEEQRLIDELGPLALNPSDKPVVWFVNPAAMETIENADNEGTKEDDGAIDNTTTQTGADAEKVKPAGERNQDVEDSDAKSRKQQKVA